MGLWDWLRGWFTEYRVMLFDTVGKGESVMAMPCRCDVCVQKRYEDAFGKELLILKGETMSYVEHGTVIHILQECYQKWLAIAGGERQDGGSDDCAACRHFGKNCYKCPLQARIQHGPGKGKGCCGGLLRMWAEEQYDWKAVSWPARLIALRIAAFILIKIDELVAIPEKKPDPVEVTLRTRCGCEKKVMMTPPLPHEYVLPMVGGWKRVFKVHGARSYREAE